MLPPSPRVRGEGRDEGASPPGRASRALPATLSIIRIARNRAEAPSRWLRSTSPRTRGEVNMDSRSRDAVASELCQRHGQERPRFRPSSDRSGSGGPEPSRSGAASRHCEERQRRSNPGGCSDWLATTNIKKEAERRETRIPSVRASRRGGAPSGAPASRRSTAVLAKGTFVTQSSASGHASWDAAGTFGPVRPPQPGGGDLARIRGRYPRQNLSQSSEAPRAPVLVPAG